MKQLASSTVVYTLLVISVIEAALVPPVCEDLGTVNRRRVGEDFSVSCRYSLSDIEENYNLQFYKGKTCVDAGGRQEVGHDTTDDPTKNALSMTTNATTLNSFLEETGRYSVVEEKTDDGVTYTMTITGVQAVDLGTFGCQIVDVSGAPTYVTRDVTSTLYVEGPPLATHFIVSDFCDSRPDDPVCASGEDEEVELVSGDEFTFHENEKVKLSFNLNHTNERPKNVKVFIGDLELPASEAYSQHGETIINSGPLVTFIFLVKYRSWGDTALEYQSNGDEVYAEITQNLPPILNVTLVERVNVTFSPKEASCVTTSKSDDAASDGKKSISQLEIACTAKGNPPVVATTWARDNNEIDVDSNPEKYGVNSEVEDDLTTSTLMVLNVGKNDSGTYRVTFENEHGTANAEAKVTRKDVGGSATWNSAPTLTIMMAAFLLAVFT